MHALRRNDPKKEKEKRERQRRIEEHRAAHADAQRRVQTAVKRQRRNSEFGTAFRAGAAGSRPYDTHYDEYGEALSDLEEDDWLHDAVEEERQRLAKQQEDAARRLQALWRGRKARCEVEKKRQQQKAAAIRIQAMLRGKKARRRVEQVRESRSVARPKSAALQQRPRSPAHQGPGSYHHCSRSSRSGDGSGDMRATNMSSTSTWVGRVPGVDEAGDQERPTTAASRHRRYHYQHIGEHHEDVERTLFLFHRSNPFRRALVGLVDSHRFQHAVTLIITLDCVVHAFLWTPTQFKVTTTVGTSDPSSICATRASDCAGVVLDLASVAFFTFEMFAKVIAHGIHCKAKKSYCKSGWNRLDLLVLFAAYASLMGEMSRLGGFVSLGAVFRSGRLLRPLRMIRSHPELQSMVNSMVAAVPNLGAVFILLLAMTSSWAIVGQNWAGGVLQGRCYYPPSESYLLPVLRCTARHNTDAAVSPGSIGSMTVDGVHVVLNHTGVGGGGVSLGTCVGEVEALFTVTLEEGVPENTRPLLVPQAYHWSCEQLTAISGDVQSIRVAEDLMPPLTAWQTVVVSQALDLETATSVAAELRKTAHELTTGGVRYDNRAEVRSLALDLDSGLPTLQCGQLRANDKAWLQLEASSTATPATVMNSTGEPLLIRYMLDPNMSSWHWDGRLVLNPRQWPLPRNTQNPSVEMEMHGVDVGRTLSQFQDRLLRKRSALIEDLAANDELMYANLEFEVDKPLDENASFIEFVMHGNRTITGGQFGPVCPFLSLATHCVNSPHTPHTRARTHTHIMLHRVGCRGVLRHQLGNHYAVVQ